MAAGNAGSPGRGGRGWGLLALVLLFAAEFVWFDTQTSRHFTWIYPRWNDQIQYLTESYTGFEYLKAHGFWAGLRATLVNPSAQGTLHDFGAVLLFCVAGPSRGAALALNLFALIAWQAALFVAVRRGTDSRPLAWAALALPLALRWAWSAAPGSAVDFRLDHLALCALGATLACALLTRGFRATGWSAIFGAATGFTLLTRFLTGTYFTLILLGLVIWILIGDHRLRRLGNLLLAVVIAAALAGPFFWINRDWVWNYYMIGHFTGPESAIRNPNMGLSTSVAWVWHHLSQNHLGPFFWWLAGAGTTLLALGFNRDRVPSPEVRAPGSDWWVPGALFLLAPALILTLHQQKSEIVVGALAPGAVVLVLALWAQVLPRQRFPWAPALLAAGCLVATGTTFVLRQLPPAGDPGVLAAARKVNALADYIYLRSQAAGLKNPRVGVDQVTDSLDGQVLRVICYERKQDWVPFIMTLPTGIMEADEALIMERLANSDFIFLTEDGSNGNWPYDRQLRALLPKTKAWCDEHLKLVERFEIFGRRMVLYQRPEIP